MIGYQLYSSRRWPLEDTLAMLRGHGFSWVEGWADLYRTPADARRLSRALEGAGLRMRTAHLPLDLVEGDPPAALDIVRALRLEAAFVPFVAERPADAEGWRALAARVARAGGALDGAGVPYGWHNHDFEFAILPDGTRPIDHIVAAGVPLELDIAWIARAGADPLEAIARHGHAVRAVHFKDLARVGGGEGEGGWADPGAGTLDWPAIAAALAPHAPASWIAEHDDPSDHDRFAGAAFKAARRIEGIPG
ncbi:sugar phosphate isomerase/epimerase [Hasllibacter halocynthiae]|uniref:Sugar phosphate isomerase/epimerase n=2 Tax=Hasllibacter halocynthiae TaxID=595589 RepID=A0A2T0X283_9RHOB|nr:sugar phosphate isomerase/epimerase [Hasllibacter halocynthiae]